MELTAERIKELERAERKLQALECGGVSNWEWYDESLSDFYKEDEEERQIAELIESIYEVICVKNSNLEIGADKDSVYQITKLIKGFVKEIKKQL